MVGTAVAAVVLGTTSVAGFAGAAAGSAQPHRTPVDQTRSALGNGLGRLVDKPAAQQKVAGHGFQIKKNALTIRDGKGRVLVDLTPQKGVNRASFRQRAEARGLVVKATDSTYGTLEGFVSVKAIGKLAGMSGTGTIAQALRPHTDTGAAVSQGVAFQRVDQVQARGVDGRGITIGALSDSYDTATTDVFGNPLAIHAANDVASGDLPGLGNPQNSQPVVVVQDGSGFDEGRGMLQIAHDVAPASKLCFATADGGQLNFANNIRRLADKAGPCRANVEVDDITYPDEPMFSDSAISDAIDDVTAQGVHYFTSAGNAGQQNAWQSPVRLLPAAQGVSGTNLNLERCRPGPVRRRASGRRPGPGYRRGPEHPDRFRRRHHRLPVGRPRGPGRPHPGCLDLPRQRSPDHADLGAVVHVHPDGCADRDDG